MEESGVRCEDIMLKLESIGLGHVKKSSIRCSINQFMSELSGWSMNHFIKALFHQEKNGLKLLYNFHTITLKRLFIKEAVKKSAIRNKCCGQSMSNLSMNYQAGACEQIFCQVHL